MAIRVRAPSRFFLLMVGMASGCPTSQSTSRAGGALEEADAGEPTELATVVIVNREPQLIAAYNDPIHEPCRETSLCVTAGDDDFDPLEIEWVIPSGFYAGFVVGDEVQPGTVEGSIVVAPPGSTEVVDHTLAACLRVVAEPTAVGPIEARAYDLTGFGQRVEDYLGQESHFSIQFPRVSSSSPNCVPPDRYYAGPITLVAR